MNLNLLRVRQLISTTVLLAGIQFVWTVELGYGTPYLLSLGLSKPLMTLVWMAGPLSGLLIQPLVGRLSDQCTMRWGRRRPYIAGGGVFVVLSVAMIAYAREISQLLLTSDRLTIPLAVIGFYILDFSINVSQACARALALDLPPLEQQDLANAYASRMISLGSVTGYLVGYMDVRGWVPWQTDSQMQALCIVSLVVFIITTGWTCWGVHELKIEKEDVPEDSSHWLRDLLQGILKLPTVVQRVCNVQFLAWIAWFPFLFFASSWVIEIMSRTAEDPKDPQFLDMATRAGSFALFLYSASSLVLSLCLPWFVDNQWIKLSKLWRLSLLWMGITLLSTYWARDLFDATLLIICMSFPWTLVLWAPFALVGEYVSTNTLPGDLSSGTLLGIHNMYVVCPQFVINLCSSLLFRWFDHTSVSEPIGWVLRVGGTSALLSFCLLYYYYYYYETFR